MDCQWIDEYELLTFFEIEPVASTPADGYWCYEVSDLRGTSLRFSFNTHEGSVQTVICFHGDEVSRVSHEGAIGLKVLKDTSGETLKGLFCGEEYQTELLVKIKPHISVCWSTLQG